MSHYNVFIKDCFSSRIDTSKVKTILELGVYDGLYTSGIQRLYSPDMIYCIECDPTKAAAIRENQQGLRNVDFTSVAIGATNGKIPFYRSPEFVASHTCIKGAEAKGFVYSEDVECLTLDRFCQLKNITSIDLICADIEGSEVDTFRDAQILKTVSYIITEMKLDNNWPGCACSYEDLLGVLKPFGFECVHKDSIENFPFGDALWVRK